MHRSSSPASHHSSHLSSNRMPPPTRSLSSSTTSTHNTYSSKYLTGQSSPRSDHTPLTPPSVGMGLRTVSHDSSRRDSWDEVDKAGYNYSLRVALLHQHLSNPPPPPLPSSTRMSMASSISTPPMPPLPSPSLQGTSPSGSRLHFSFSRSPRTPDQGAYSSDGTTPSSTPNPAVPGMTRRKSSFGLNKAKKEEALKLPKEFLLEFWGTLANEDGDQGWKDAVATFLGMIKKGTKTPSGLNLRELPTLLETFTTVVPALSPTSAATHVHQSHLLQLLYNSLPRSSHFSPIARSQTEKDKDLLFRLRAEVQSYMLAASPDPQADLASAGFHTTSTAPRYSPGLGLGRTISSTSGHSSHSGSGGEGIKRKPSPVWIGDAEGSGVMAETVGIVWGVGREAMEKDVYNIRRTGQLDQLYMADIKRMLSAFSTLPQPLSPTLRSRQQALSAQLTHLLQSFPDLGIPGSPADFSSHTIDEASEPSFFIPPRTREVFGRLAQRASEIGHTARNRDLVEECREIWGVSSRREKEKEVESLVQRWTDSIGTREETEWGRSVEEGVKDLLAGAREGDPLPPVLSGLLSTLLDLLKTDIVAIFPSTALPPPPPPPSLIAIFRAGGTHFLDDTNAAKVLDDLSDELKGSAVGEYVAAVGNYMGGVGGTNNAFKLTRGERDGEVEGFQAVANWIEAEISNVRKVWGDGVGQRLNPAAIILSRQLPLFCAELQGLDRPRVHASDTFGLYEVTGRLLDLWEELCPGQDHGFELDSFFEPHVLAWLKDTEDNTTQEWVSRAVGMDSWVPEGDNKHSQSVIDLFEFIRGSAKVVLHDLPLGEYKRAVYIIDLSKTVSIAVTQYASTVSALFTADMHPIKASTPTSELTNKLEGKLGGKASSWLAKGQQAVKSLDKKRIDGFVIPPAACVKLTDMGASQTCLDDMVYALEAEETARIVQSHKLPNAAPERTRHVFEVTIMRAQSMLAKGLNKPADGFVVVTDTETGERLLKTKTVLGVEDPRWEQTFEVSVGRVKILELTAYDRQLMGKHDPIGSGSFKLDPRSFTGSSTRDILLPLSPRGTVHLRISMEGGEKHDVAYHLSTAGRALQRAEGDMTREITDRMAEFIRAVLSHQTLQNLTKPLKDKKKPRAALGDGELEGSLGELFAYFNENFSVFSFTLTTPTRINLMLAIWKRIVDVLISLLVPPLSDKPYASKEALGSHEIDVVFKWLQLLKGFFNASEGGVEHGVPLSQLQQGNYKDLIMLGQYLDLPTPSLRERCSAAVKGASQQRGGLAGLSMGSEEDNVRMAEVLLRIARTRPDMGDFLSQQIGTLTRARIERQAGVL